MPTTAKHEPLRDLKNLPKQIEKKPTDNSMRGDADQEIAVFTEAVKVPLNERDSFLLQRCGEDDKLRRKVESLLRAHDHLGDFLEIPRSEASVFARFGRSR